MRTCVIFNPAARGQKVLALRRRLGAMAAGFTFKETTAPGDARRFAAEAVLAGCERVIAAGGDGTLNEALNGLGDVPDGFARAGLGVLPLGTVNVFARELGIPLAFEPAWAVLQAGREVRLDLPRVEFQAGGRPCRRYFAQLAGAGLDARAIELVSWSHKQKVGPLAYVIAGLRALMSQLPQIKISAGHTGAAGELILVGNGKRYGGNYRVFPEADLRDGQLDVCVFPRAGWLTLARCGLPLLLRGNIPATVVRRFQADTFTLTSETPVSFELDGELIGRLPATFFVEPARLRVLVP